VMRDVGFFFLGRNLPAGGGSDDILVLVGGLLLSITTLAAVQTVSACILDSRPLAVPLFVALQLTLSLY
jgi:hypothetical protein